MIAAGPRRNSHGLETEDNVLVHTLAAHDDAILRSRPETFEGA
jgi:tRNA threonylcarbamoyladenosine modification (KEOPS) complex  Pcc1 subunit